MTDMPRVSPSVAAFARLGEGLTDSLCDTMVERLATTGSNALEVVDKLNQPDIKEGLLTVLDTIGNMHRTGVLQTVVDALYLVHAARSAASDSMIERMFIFIEHMVNNFATEDLATLAHEAKGAMEDALDSCGIPGASGGLMGTIRMMSKPETQEALRFMLAFSCSLRKRVVVISKSAQTP
jgi:uncharacterized protein YjgD (DUF1641 family)